MKWNPFGFSGQTYDLSHLHPFEMEVVVPVKDGKPEQAFPFLVEFSLHCFTRTIEAGDSAALEYSDNRETRTFCFDRHRLSRHLPKIIREIGTKQCSHTGQGNFFIVELIDHRGLPVEYEVYFDVSRKSKAKGRMKLFVQSAYVRDAAGQAYRPNPKRIRFHVIAYNTKIGKPIKIPR